MKKNGFTLVELLAVIAILSILVAIVMPNVMEEYNKAKADIFVTDSKSFMNAAISEFTTDAMNHAGETIYYSSKPNSDLNTSKLSIDSDKEYFIEMDRHGNIKRLVIYDESYCYDIFTTYGDASIGILDGTKSKNNNGQPISKVDLDVNGVWDSGNDSVEIVVNKNEDVVESYFVKGCEAKEHSFDNDIVAESNALTLYGVLQKEAEEGTYAKKYTGEHKDSYTRSASYDIYHFHADSDDEANMILSKNNVLFANHCWQMIRTTDTGGVKLLYNGEVDSNGKCGTDRGEHAGYEQYVADNIPSGDNYYGTSYTYDSVRKSYKLSGTISLVTSSDSVAPSLVGKYTCKLNEPDGSCRVLYYLDSYIEGTRFWMVHLNYFAHYSTIGDLYYNLYEESISSVGYMFGDIYERERFSVNISNGVYFGSSVIYDGGKYKLQDTIYKTEYPTNSEYNSYRFYCSDGSLECDSVGYIFHISSVDFKDVIFLKNGVVSPKVALDSMVKDNRNNSIIKTGVDEWFENNLLDYSNYLEETIYCNDRSFSNYNDSGWNLNGGDLQNQLLYNQSNFSGSLNCKQSSDQFSVNNNSAKLKYSIGLPTTDEIKLLNNPALYTSGSTYWLNSPNYIDDEGMFIYDYYQMMINTMKYDGSFDKTDAASSSLIPRSYSTSSSVVNPDGSISVFAQQHHYQAKSSLGIRPMISLKAGISFVSGDGSVGTPYIVN